MIVKTETLRENSEAAFLTLASIVSVGVGTGIEIGYGAGMMASGGLLFLALLVDFVADVVILVGR